MDPRGDVNANWSFLFGCDSQYQIDLNFDGHRLPSVDPFIK